MGSLPSEGKKKQSNDGVDLVSEFDFREVLSGPHVLRADIWIENHHCLWLLAVIPSSLQILLLGPLSLPGSLPRVSPLQRFAAVLLRIQMVTTAPYLPGFQSGRQFGLACWVQSSGLTYSILVPHSHSTPNPSHQSHFIPLSGIFCPLGFHWHHRPNSSLATPCLKIQFKLLNMV